MKINLYQFLAKSCGYANNLDIGLRRLEASFSLGWVVLGARKKSTENLQTLNIVTDLVVFTHARYEGF